MGGFSVVLLILREEKSEGEEKMWVGGGKCGEGG